MIEHQYNPKQRNAIIHVEQHKSVFYVDTPIPSDQVVSTAASSSLVAVGGIAGIGRNGQKSKMLSPEENPVPSYGATKAYDIFDSGTNMPPNTTVDANSSNLTNEYFANNCLKRVDTSKPQLSPSSSSLVAATMKISSATTEVYNKNGVQAGVNRHGGIAAMNREPIEKVIYNSSDKSTNQKLQPQVSLL